MAARLLLLFGSLKTKLQANVTIQLWKGRDWNEESAARLDSQSTTMNSIESWQQMARVLAKNGVQMILSSCWRLDSSGSSHWMSWYNCDPFSFTSASIIIIIIIAM